MALRRLAVSALSLGLAAGAAGAQENAIGPLGPGPAGACGQPAALTHTLPLPADRSAPAPAAVTLERSEPRYVEFTLGGPAEVGLRTAAPGGAGGYLILFDEGGRAVGWDSGSGDDGQALIDGLALGAGSYCAQLRSLDPAPGTVQEMVLTLAATPTVAPPPDTAGPPCADPALTADVGRLIVPGFDSLALTGFVTEGSRRDWRMTVAAPTDLQLLVASPQLETILTLHDRAGTLLAEHGDGPASEIAASLAPGEYCLGVRDAAGRGGAVMLTVAEGAPPAIPQPEPEPEPAPEPAPEPEPAPVPPLAAMGGPCGEAELTAAADRPVAPGFGRIDMAATVARNSRRNWVVEVSAPADLLLEAMSTEFDTVLALHDAAGTLLAENDDRPGGGTDSEITTRLDRGAYCLSVRGFAGAGGAVRVAVSEPGAPPPIEPPPPVVPPQAVTPGPDAPCGDPALAADAGRPVAPGFGSVRLGGTVERNSRRDWLFRVTAPTTLMLEAMSAEFDTVLALHDITGALIAENDDRPQGGTDSEIIQALQPGDYCASVRGFGGGGGAVTVVLSESGAAPPGLAGTGPCSDPALTADLGRVLAPGFGSLALTGRIAQRSHGDWTMTLAEGMELQLNAASTEFDTMLELYDAGGRLLAENDDAPGQGTNSEIVATLAAGQHCIRVLGFAGSGGGYDLGLSETAAPAPEGAPPGAGEGLVAMGTVTDTAEGAQTVPDATVWFGFDVAAAGDYRLQVLGLGGPFTLQLWEGADRVLTEVEAAGGMDIAMFDIALQPGRAYAVAVIWADPPAIPALRQLAVLRR